MSTENEQNDFPEQQAESTNTEAKLGEELYIDRKATHTQIGVQAKFPGLVRLQPKEGVEKPTNPTEEQARDMAKLAGEAENPEAAIAAVNAYLAANNLTDVEAIFIKRDPEHPLEGVAMPLSYYNQVAKIADEFASKFNAEVDAIKDPQERANAYRMRLIAIGMIFNEALLDMPPLLGNVVMRDTEEAIAYAGAAHQYAQELEEKLNAIIAQAQASGAAKA